MFKFLSPPDENKFDLPASTSWPTSHALTIEAKRSSCAAIEFWVKFKMAIFSVYVLNRAGGLIYHYDHHTPKSEVEKTFSYPLDITLRGDDKLEVIFGEGGGIKGELYLNISDIFNIFSDKMH